MIASLTGSLKYKSPTEVLIDVHGVGYAVHIPLSTFEKLPDVDAPVTLFTHLNVREDALQLYGFASEEERTLFRQLISVSGIGPKIAQGILSGISASDLRVHITTGNIAALTSIPGVGRKTAERLIVELKEKVGKGEVEPVPGTRAGNRAQALLALLSLGYARQAADKAIRSVLNESNGANLSLEEFIKQALRHVGK